MELENHMDLSLLDIEHDYCALVGVSLLKSPWWCYCRENGVQNCLLAFGLCYVEHQQPIPRVNNNDHHRNDSLIKDQSKYTREKRNEDTICFSSIGIGTLIVFLILPLTRLYVHKHRHKHTGKITLMEFNECLFWYNLVFHIFLSEPRTNHNNQIGFWFRLIISFCP